MIFLRTGLSSRIDQITDNQNNRYNDRDRQYPFYLLFHISSGIAAAMILPPLFLFIFPFVLFFVTFFCRLTDTPEYRRDPLKYDLYEPYDDF